MEAGLSSYIDVLRARIRSGGSGSVLDVYTVRLVLGSLLGIQSLRSMYVGNVCVD